jgi:hypothetical protein
MSSTTRKAFIARWLFFNLVGWIAADIIIARISESPKPSITSIALWLPLGVGIGIMDWLLLRRAKFYAVPWIVAIAFSVGISGATLSASLLNNDSYAHPLWMNLFYGIVGILLSPIALGVFEAKWLAGVISRPKLWIACRILGFPIFAFLLILVGGAGAYLGKHLVYYLFYFSRDLWFEMLSGRDYYFMLFLLVILPILGTLSTALPTSLLLSMRDEESASSQHLSTSS